MCSPAEHIPLFIFLDFAKYLCYTEIKGLLKGKNGMKLVFVSSTFKDMQFERDALNTYVAPLIDSALAPHGEAVYFGDLRWGVNTTELDSEESSKKVLDVCLDEIDNCKPYMIVLIGERYGWIPGAELLHTAAVTKGIDTPTDISVTQLEIEYGALLNPDYEGRILFYFRNLDKTGMTEAERRDYEAESDAHRAKLDALKARIAEIYPDAIRYYDAKWNPDTHAVEELMPLMELIREDLLRVFSADINRDNGIPWQERAMNAAHRYCMEHSRHYMDITPGSRAPLAGIYLDRGRGRLGQNRLHISRIPRVLRSRRRKGSYSLRKGA